MIYYVKGTLEELYADRAVIDCSGVGYMLTITSKTYDYLSDGAFRADGGSAGKQVKLYTYVRIADESRFETFGFAKKEELSMFNLLQTVSGIGAKAAMAILSALDVENLCGAIADENIKLRSTAQGVGPKAAQKICIDLKSKLEKFMLENSLYGKTYSGAAADVTSRGNGRSLGDNQKLAAEALVNLGYSKPEANKAVSAAGSGSVEEIIRKALSSLL